MQTTRKAPSASELLEQANLEGFLATSSELPKLFSTIQKTLDCMEREPTNYRQHLECVRTFLSTLWRKYDCEEIINILDALTAVEPPLLDLERSGTGKYRDHFVHVFNVFLTGLRFINVVMNELGDDEARKLFKVTDERVNDVIPEFSKNYTWKERLFYLWTLVSNFHDISIPITKLKSVGNALNEFVGKFGMQVSGPVLLPYFPSDLEDYFHTLGRIFEGRLEPEGWCYRKEKPNPYLESMLRYEFYRQNHGVLSGFLMYSKMRDIFLQGGNKPRPLSPRSFNQYVDCVLKQDIARAALAISLHDLRPDQRKYPQVLPLDFLEYPLTGLLIIVDSTQEYLRWEGTSVVGGTKLLLCPQLEVALEAQERLQVHISFFVTRDGEDYLVDQAKTAAQRLNVPFEDDSVGGAAQVLCNCMAEELRSKLSPNRLQLYLHFWDDEKELFRRCVHY